MRNSKASAKASVAIPEDVRTRLLEGGVKQAFERRPVAEQRRNLDWIRKAGNETVRRKRIDGLIDSLQREAQYETSRWTYSLGSRRSSA